MVNKLEEPLLKYLKLVTYCICSGCYISACHQFKVRNVTFDTNIQHWNDRSDPRVLKTDFVYFWNQIM